MKFDGVPYVNVGRIIYQCQFGSDLKKKKKKKSVNNEDEKPAVTTVVEDEEEEQKVNKPHSYTLSEKKSLKKTKILFGPKKKRFLRHKVAFFRTKVTKIFVGDESFV